MNPDRTLRIATRGSKLARVQTDWVVHELLQTMPNLRFEIVTIQTTGDAILDRSLDRVGGKGLFTEELERAISSHQVDLAVHSLKDLPTELPPGLTLGALPRRQDPRDALIGVDISELRNPTRPLRIGTSSLRRIAQLRRLFPAILAESMRGNVDTRIRKINDGLYDGAVLALAGLRRIGREDAVTYAFTDEEILPAPGQGALAVEIRSDDVELRRLLSTIHDQETEHCVRAERTFLQCLGGGCQVPVGAHAVEQNGMLTLKGNVIALDGSVLLKGTVQGQPNESAKIAKQLANDLLAQGAAKIIDTIKRTEHE